MAINHSSASYLIGFCKKKEKKYITQNENDKLKKITSGRIGYVLK
jgi:hypothetical protein